MVFSFLVRNVSCSPFPEEENDLDTLLCAVAEENSDYL